MVSRGCGMGRGLQIGRTMKRLALVLSIALLGGCQMSVGAKTATIVSGLALAGAGVFVAQPDGAGAEDDGFQGTHVDDDIAGVAAGTLLVLVGSVIALAGAAASTPPEEPLMAAVPASTLPPSVIYTGPAAYDAPGGPAILPELPVTEPTLVLGKQVRSAAANGRCEHAWLMWRRINEQDSRYAAALISGDVLAPCRR